MNQAIINDTSQKRNYPFITFILFWCGLTLLTSMYITIPLTSVFSEEFQITLDQTSWIGSSFSLCYALGCLLYGPISDKYGRKVLMVTSISVLTAVTFMIGFVHSYHALVFLRAVQGLVAAAFAPISLVYAGEMFPPNKRVTVVGFISTGLLMAGIIGQIFSGLINQLLGWNAIFFILGIVYLFSAVLVIIALPKEDLPKSNEHIWSKFKQIKLLFHQPQLLLCFAVTFMLLFTLVGMYTILGSYLSSPKFGLTSDQILCSCSWDYRDGCCFFCWFYFETIRGINSDAGWSFSICCRIIPVRLQYFSNSRGYLKCHFCSRDCGGFACNHLAHQSKGWEC